MPNQAASRKYDVITFGDMCVDLIVSGPDVTPEFGQVEKLVEDYTLEMGGSCCIFACQAARLGLRTAILGKVGKDRFGELILNRLEESGVDTRFVTVDAALKTGLGIALCPPGDRAILTYMGTINVLQPGDVKEDFLASAGHLHHASYFLHTGLRPAVPDIFRQARRLGSTISLDTNWDPEEKWGPELRQLIPLVDVILPNEQEALRITGAADLDAAVEGLHWMGAPLAVVKRGDKGALVSDRQRSLTQSVQPADSGGDSIGAGDSFDAGFLAGWLRGCSIESSLAIACECGRSVASSVGGLHGQLDWKAVSHLADG